MLTYVISIQRCIPSLKTYEVPASLILEVASVAVYPARGPIGVVVGESVRGK
jgi:hypothetical protein